jgi:myo-inositol-1(or 4)-monophosphatase
MSEVNPVVRSGFEPRSSLQRRCAQGSKAKRIMTEPNREILEHISSALQDSAKVVSRFTHGAIACEYKSGHDPVTEADRAINEVLRLSLPRPGEGWLSEEATDNPERLSCERVWVVDPLDGTREFVAGIPEWCISVALVERGRGIAAGVLNPATDETFLGAMGSGITYNGQPAFVTGKSSLDRALVLASRSEVCRGEWKRFQQAGFTTLPMGSVAYKLARVAAGLADATFTLVPKHEWDIAAGVVLIESAGGFAINLDGLAPRFNNPDSKLRGLIAGTPGLRSDLMSLTGIQCTAPE